MVMIVAWVLGKSVPGAQFAKNPVMMIMDCGFLTPSHRLVEAWRNCKLLRRR